MNTKFKLALQLFDEANSHDPVKEFDGNKEIPKELLYAIRMTETLEAFEPNAPESVKLAARCQHICRWEIPRDSYEMNRVGYLTWRKDLTKFHAEKASKLLSKAGYDEDMINRVGFLLQKKQLKKNEDTQLLEDVICLVFLRYYFERFSKKYDEHKLIEILKKTWAKMSSKGQKAALKIPYSKVASEIIQKALS